MLFNINNQCRLEMTYLVPFKHTSWGMCSDTSSMTGFNTASKLIQVSSNCWRLIQPVHHTTKKMAHCIKTIFTKNSHCGIYKHTISFIVFLNGVKDEQTLNWTWKSNRIHWKSNLLMQNFSKMFSRYRKFKSLFSVCSLWTNSFHTCFCIIASLVDKMETKKLILCTFCYIFALLQLNIIGTYIKDHAHAAVYKQWKKITQISSQLIIL